jgi:hypothetical protein
MPGRGPGHSRAMAWAGTDSRNDFAPWPALAAETVWARPCRRAASPHGRCGRVCWLVQRAARGHTAAAMTSTFLRADTASASTRPTRHRRRRACSRRSDRRAHYRGDHGDERRLELPGPHCSLASKLGPRLEVVNAQCLKLRLWRYSVGVAALSPARACCRLMWA